MGGCVRVPQDAKDFRIRELSERLKSVLVNEVFPKIIHESILTTPNQRPAFYNWREIVRLEGNLLIASKSLGILAPFNPI